MANPFDQLNQHVQDLHNQAGWSGTVYNEVVSSDDGDWVDRSAETVTWDDGTDITIRIEASRQPDDRRDASGRVVFGDVVIIVGRDPTDGYTQGGYAEGGYGTDALFTGGDETRAASEIVDDRTGQRYRVLRVRDQRTGVLRLDCEELT